MTPKVSVCMISYRHAAFIAQAIESVLAQQCDFEIELVIGDDCSPDGTGAICDEFARRDPRVRLLPRDRNLGVMANFSRTLQACRGEYVAVCEGDDYWIDPLKLAKQVAFLDAHPATPPPRTRPASCGMASRRAFSARTCPSRWARATSLEADCSTLHRCCSDGPSSTPSRRRRRCCRATGC